MKYADMSWLRLVAVLFVISPSKVFSFLQLNGQNQIFTQDANNFVNKLNLVKAEICLENFAALSDKSFFYSNMTFKEVLSKWQYLNGLQDFGILNYETMMLMTSTNCKPRKVFPSTNDINRRTDEISEPTKNRKYVRNKRYIKTIEDVKWDTNHITYCIKRSPHYFSRRKIEELLARAFDRWTDVSILDFTRVDCSVDTNIKIVFKVWEDYQYLNHSRDHYKNLFASAYLPKDGEIFIYEDNLITCNENHVVVVMINAIGHALGLFLSNEEESLMYPIYNEQMDDLQFFGDEIKAIERLYGTRRNKLEEICNRLRQYSIDAAFYDNGKSLVYIFQGHYFFTFDDNGQQQEERTISSFWKDVAGPISGAVYSSASHRTYLFKKKFMWRFFGNKHEVGPCHLKKQFGLPKKNSAVILGEDDKFYLLKKNRYSLLDEYNMYEPKVKGKRIRGRWKGWSHTDEEITAAFRWHSEDYFITKYHIFKTSTIGSISRVC